MAVVHEEVAALPEADRSAFVLCVLEGLTQAEAAVRLGHTPGVVAGQVARAKKRLVTKLARRGVVPGVAALGTVSAADAAPPGLLERVLVMRGTEVSPAVLRLAKGALGMTVENTKMIVFTVALVVGLAAVAAVAATDSHASQPKILAARSTNARLADPGDAPPGKMPNEGPLKTVRSLLGHKDRVTSVAYSPDGRWIATASWDGTARVWDAKTGKEGRLLKLPALKSDNPGVPPTRPTQILFSPNSEFLAVSCQPNDVNQVTVIVWNRGTGEKVLEFQGFCAAFSPDGKFIACGGWGMTNIAQCGIRIHEFPTGKLVREMTGEQAVIVSMTYSCDGQTLVSKGQMPSNLSGIEPCIVSVWDVGTGKQRRSGLTGVLAEDFALSPDSRNLAVAPFGSDVILRESATGGQRAKMVGHTELVFEIAFSSDGRTLATASMDKTVRLWDVALGKEIGRLEGHTDWVQSVAFSPDGQMLVSCGVDQTARVWDVSRITQRPRVSKERSAAELEADWKDLGGDAAKAYAAVDRLVSSPEGGVPFLGKRLQTSAAVDTKPIEQLVAKLGDDEFQIRERATKDLEAMADRAAPTLRKALAINPSPEVRQRLVALLSRVDGVGPSSETAREIRAVEVLEAIGTPKARKLLETLAAGPPGTHLMLEAKASTDRLARQSSIRP